VLYYTNSDGANPDMALTVSGSVLYGTTENGGPASYGTVFTMNTDGTGYTVLHTFTNNPDGAYPDGGCYEIENTKRRNMGDFADFEENRLAFG